MYYVHLHCLSARRVECMKGRWGKCVASASALLSISSALGARGRVPLRYECTILHPLCGAACTYISETRSKCSNESGFLGHRTCPPPPQIRERTFRNGTLDCSIIGDMCKRNGWRVGGRSRNILQHYVCRLPPLPVCCSNTKQRAYGVWHEQESVEITFWCNVLRDSATVVIYL